MALFNGCIRSASIHGNTWVQVATPDETKKDDKPYKVIYLLHGTTGNSMDWVRYTMLPLYSIEHKVVFVIPEIANTWGRNIPDRGDFFNYIVDELPDLIGGMFNISSKREDVAIMGNSAGAYTAMRCALLHPEQYWLCGAFSTACVFLDQYLDYLRNQIPEVMENPHLRTVYGSDLKCTPDDILLELAQKASVSNIKPIIYMTIGEQDFLYEPNQAFNKEMQKLPFDYTYETWAGTHDWYFWDKSLKKALDKYYPVREKQG